MWSTLYHKDQDTILKCGRKLSIASLAVNSQGNVKFDHVYANGKSVRIVCDNGSTVLCIFKHVLNNDDITDKSLKRLTFGGTVESFQHQYSY